MHGYLKVLVAPPKTDFRDDRVGEGNSKLACCCRRLAAVIALKPTL